MLVVVPEGRVDYDVMCYVAVSRGFAEWHIIKHTNDQPFNSTITFSNGNTLANSRVCGS